MAEPLVLVDRASDWLSSYPIIPVATVRDYLDNPDYGRQRRRIINLSRHYRYLSEGYYASLLAEARHHPVLPAVRSINDLSRKATYGLDLDDLATKLPPQLDEIAAGSTTLALYFFFGQSPYSALKLLGQQLFELFPVPILRLELQRREHWRINEATIAAFHRLDEEQRELFIHALTAHLAKRWRRRTLQKNYRYDLAILYNPNELLPPSNPAALARFEQAASQRNLYVEKIKAQDFTRIAEFDALFIRETTRISHHTYRFAKRAEREGLVVIDDPDSILRCTNKVFLFELLRGHRLPTPKTVVLRRDNLASAEALLGFPMVLKIPDGAFSQGVIKVDSHETLLSSGKLLTKTSELILAQEFVYTEYDWRIGVLNRQPLYACRYFMAQGHWQIYNHASSPSSGEESIGDAETLAIDEVPRPVLQAALKAAQLLGDGLYGVDLKQTPRGVMIIEVNDNPNIDHGVEDLILGERLYESIIDEFIRRLTLRRERR